MAALYSTLTEIAMIRISTKSGTILLPGTSTIQGRQVGFKDYLGTLTSNSTVTFSTQNGDFFEDGTTSKVFSNAYAFGTFYTGSTSRWNIIGGNVLASMNVTSMNVNALQVNSLTIGTGTGWLGLNPIQTLAVSTIQTNTSTLYANTAFMGGASTLTAIQFYGLTGTYSNTVIAEQSTGTGLQEFVVFRGSSASDRIRMQTTGSIVFEPGVSARTFSGAAALTTPTMSMQSNLVGIGISGTPASLLDVGGRGRFQAVSTLALDISSINGAVYGGGTTFTGSTIYVSASKITTSSLEISSITSGTWTIPENYVIGINDTTSNTTSSGILVMGIGAPATYTAPTYASTIFSTTNILNTFIVPPNVNNIYVQLWGAGGGGVSTVYGGTGSGGGGAYVAGTIYVKPGATLYGIVGLGGQCVSTVTIPTGTFLQGGGGGTGDTNAYGRSGSACGGGFTTIFQAGTVSTFSTFYAIAGGGGGGGGGGAAGGWATASGTSFGGTNNSVGLNARTTHAGPPTAGFYIAGGAGGQYGPGEGASINTPTYPAGNGTKFFGGGPSGGGGGGGGYYGGGAGNGDYGNYYDSGSGGAGSSYSDLLINQRLLDAISTVPGGVSLPQYALNAGKGGFGSNSSVSAGSNGLIIITYLNLAVIKNKRYMDMRDYNNSTVTYLDSNGSLALQSPSSIGGYTLLAGGPAYVSTLITDYSHTNKLNVYGNTAIYGNTVLSGDLTVSSITSINGVTASTLFIGTDPRRSYLGFYGSYGTYDRSVIAEMSNGNTGQGAHDAQQELVFFRGSNAGDGIRMQTTGYIKFETGASARVFPSVTSLTTPTMIMTSDSNVGIRTATPSFPLDVAGTGRFQLTSTLGLNVSSINSAVYPPPFVVPSSLIVSTLTASSTIQGQALIGLTKSSTWSQTASVGAKNWSGVTGGRVSAIYYACVNAGYIYYSSNGGVSWTQQATVQAWTGIGTGATATNAVACVAGGGIYYTTNSGTTWTISASPTANWSAVCGSYNSGSTFYACVNGGGVYISTNSGANWTLITGSVNATWSAINCSNDGDIMVVVNKNAATYKNLWFQNGTAGTLTADTDSPIGNWNSVALVRQGNPFFAILGRNDGLIRITNRQNFDGSGFGVYNSVNASGFIGALASGFTIVACLPNNPIVVSYNRGASWLPTNSPSLPWSCAVIGQLPGTTALIDDQSIYNNPTIVGTNTGFLWSDIGFNNLPTTTITGHNTNIYTDSGSITLDAYNVLLNCAGRVTARGAELVLDAGNGFINLDSAVRVLNTKTVYLPKNTQMASPAGTDVRQPFIQYGTASGSGGSGTVAVTIPQGYTTLSSYVVQVTMRDSPTAELYATPTATNSFTIGWSSGGSGTQNIMWTTFGI